MRLRAWGVVLAIAFIFAVVSPITAQEVGSRVRVTAPSHDLDQAEGTLQATTSDGLVVQFLDSDVTIERSEIQAMDVSTGQRGRALKGLGVGFLAGFGVGALAGLADGDDPSGFLSFSAEEKAVLLGVTLGVGGGLVGLLIGSTMRSDIWEPANLSDRGFVLLPLVGPETIGLRISLAVK